MELVHKYRPSSFDDLVGLEEIKNYLNGDNIAHGYVFFGNPGVGKTTVARIIGNMLDAEVIEINAADSRGIDKAREIIESLDRPTLSGKPQLFIIDEAHQLSDAAQNALLKPLGDDGLEQDFVVFCTTEPTKIKKTLRDRCQQFNFPDLTNNDLMELLNSILGREGIELDETIKEVIVENSEGSARLTVILLDRYLKSGNIDSILGYQDDANDSFFQVLMSLWNFKKDKTLADVLKAASDSKNPEGLRIFLLNSFNKTFFTKGQSPIVLKAIEVLLDTPPLVGADKAIRLNVILFKVRTILDSR